MLYVRAAESGIEGEVLNVGSGSTYSINYLIHLLGGDVVYIPKRPGEPDCTFADVNEISRALGWQAGVSFEEGVENMLQVIDHWSDAPVWDKKSIAEATREWFTYLRDSPSQTNSKP